MEFFHHAETWELVAFILFVGLMVYLKVPAKVTAMLDERATKIANELAEAFAHAARAKVSESLERRGRQAEQNLAQAEAQAIKEVRNIATDLAVAAATHLVGDAAKGAAGTRLVENAISQVKSKLN